MKRHNVTNLILWKFGFKLSKYCVLTCQILYLFTLWQYLCDCKPSQACFPKFPKFYNQISFKFISYIWYRLAALVTQWFCHDFYRGGWVRKKPTICLFLISHTIYRIYHPTVVSGKTYIFSVFKEILYGLIVGYTKNYRLHYR